MADDPAHDVTLLLADWRRGDDDALEELLPAVLRVWRRNREYRELTVNDMGEGLTATPSISGGALFIRTRTRWDRKGIRWSGSGPRRASVSRRLSVTRDEDVLDPLPEETGDPEGQR